MDYKQKSLTGGVNGVPVGVSNMDNSINFYNKILGFDKIEYDVKDTFTEFDQLHSHKQAYRRVLLTRSKNHIGGFGKFIGPIQIELIEAADVKGKNIFENRYWGDLGYIHVCFDIKGIQEFDKYVSTTAHPLTINSNNSFDMGEAAGQFAYNEDPDGTLIEYVETHKVPIIKKWGWYLNMKNRSPEKPLPDFMIKSLSFNRVK